MADDDSFLNGSGEVDPEQQSASYGFNTSAGPFNAAATLSGQEYGVPSLDTRLAANFPEGFSTTLSRSGQVGDVNAHARNAIEIAKQFDNNSRLGLEASRMGDDGPLSYGAQLTGQIGRQGGPKHYYPEPQGHWQIGAGMSPGERHITGGAKFNFANGGHIDAALHAARQHFEGGGLSDLFSGPDIMSTGNAPSPGDWGNPEVGSDFFKADKAALALAKQAAAPDDDVTGSIPTRRAPAPVSIAAPAPAPAPDVDIPFSAPDKPYLFSAAQAAPAPDQPLAYTDLAPAAPAQTAIHTAMTAAPKLTGRAAPQPGMTDLTPQQTDYIIRTIAAESSGNPEESQGIANVIMNRINSGRFGPTPEHVLFSKNQFEPWSNKSLANYPLKIKPDSDRYQAAAGALDAALQGEDNTGGATYFWGPGSQYARGRNTPSWANKFPDYTDIGATRFHREGRADGGEVDAPDEVNQALDVVRQAPETNALGMTPDQFAEYTQTKAPPASGFVESALRNVREYAMPRGEDYTHAMDQSAAAADYLTKSGKEGMLSGNPWEMAKGAGMSMLGTALPVIAPVGAALEAGVVNPAERVLGPAGRQAAEVATMVPGEGATAAMKIAQATGEAAPYAAIFAGPMAKTADIHALEIAKDLATKGADREEIIGKTGWFQGSDGKWRFEIPDVQSKVTDQVYNNIKEKGIHEGTLPTALEHPELYEAYPQLNEMQATFGASAKPRGSYSPWSKDISVEGPSVANQRSTALHEAQHAVQQIEGFARGADNIYLKPNTPAWDIYQERLKAIKTPMTPKQFEESGVGSPEYSYSEYLKQTKDSIKNNGPMLDRAAQDYAVQEAYRRSAGEVEARNVQARRNMNPSALKAEMPWQTQSVPNEQQIVKFHNTEPQMSAPAYQGEHGAPMKDSGSPLYNVTGVYPKDFYSGKGFQYYADLGSEKNMDLSSYGTINSYLGMPDRPITVYRAVPKDPAIKGINKGDWVTINRDYAKEHGQGALNGDYKILKKQVYARDLFTAGDSHHEWGYDPQPTSGLKREDKAAIRKDVRGYEKGGSVEDRALMLVSKQA